MSAKQLILFHFATFVCFQYIEANTLFRFAFDFHVKNGEEDSSKEVINKTIALENNQISILDNNNNSTEVVQEQLDNTTSGPIWSEIWNAQYNLNEVANDKLKSTRDALFKLNKEISPLVGRSDVIAAKVKLITRYLNDAAASDSKNFEILRKFVILVDELKAPPAPEKGGERSMEYVLMKLALNKYQMLQLQQQVQEEVMEAEQAWQRYVKEKLVEVAA